MRYFTQSELRTWRRCRRKWWLGTYRRLQLDPSLSKPGAASQGTLVHGALERLYTPGGNWETYLQDQHDYALQLWEETSEEYKTWIKQLELAHVMVEGYIEWLAESGADEQIKVLAPEQKVAVNLTEDIGLMGKLDQIIHDAFDDSIGFLDFKTVGEFTTIPKNAQRDEQFLHYSLILKMKSPESRPAGGIWRMLKKSKRTARATPPFYAEHRYRFNKHQLDSYYRRVWQIITEITDATAALEAGADPLAIMYPMPMNDCSWSCDFKDVCTMFDNGDRVEQFIEDWYVEGDPLSRYAESSEGEG